MTSPGHPLRIGLTGPIGCGKSTVAGWLAERGAVVVDADALAREVTAPGTPGLAAVVARFGPAYVRSDGSLDRRRLGRLVFADPAALADLEAIVHPAVRPLVLEALGEAERRGRPAVVEAIKLTEGGLDAYCDEVWVVTCDAASQRIRLRTRGLSSGEATRRIAAQEELVERMKAVATLVLDTSGSPDETRRLVDVAYAQALEAHTLR